MEIRWEGDFIVAWTRTFAIVTSARTHCHPLYFFGRPSKMIQTEAEKRWERVKLLLLGSVLVPFALWHAALLATNTVLVPVWMPKISEDYTSVPLS